jgi:hypothetical protein
MGLMADDSGKDIEPIPEGVYQAICYAIYDLGTQTSELYGDAHQCLISWEIPEVRIEYDKDGQHYDLPRAISKYYTVSLHEKSNLRKALVSWRGRAFTPEELKGFDVQKLLGANCMLQIIHTNKNDKVRAEVASILPLYKGLQRKEAENPLVMFSFSEYDGGIPKNVPSWVMKKIEQSKEWKLIEQGSSQNESDGLPSYDDDVPF